MISFNSNQNLFKFVLFILFCNFCQPTSPKSQSQIEFFKTAHEMLESAPNAIFENNLVANGIEGISITNWLYKYSGVMCSENFDEKIEKDGQNDILDGKFFENFKTIRNNLCQEFNNGKGMEKAAKKVENLTINVLEYFGNDQKTKIAMQKFVQINGQTIQKDVKNVFYGFLSKLKIEKLVKNFDLELKTFFDALTGTAEKDDSFCTQRQNVDNAKFLIQRRRRRKRMERTTTFDIEQVGGEASSIHTYTPCTPLVCAFFTAVGAIALVIMMYPFNYVFYGDPAPKFVALFVMALLLLFAAIGSFIYHRCACYMAFRIRYLANRPPI